ncbi:FHA domain-containing protein [Tahibacter amnicola]|uniref:FHA domain-containing protein n=1 Tax=Tahibacter amnicola TaxID=2976241 RepID=A0ABY6BLQ3_9GAMM|nr:FHA domain-containing protein [Tahibacter amnicola]UXI68742.1 FHA domain-containing protein [Tahibacter amnicola]
MTNERLAALEAVDLSAVADLKHLKAEQDILAERLTQLEERRSAVADAVYLRVRGDYQARTRELETKSAPLKQQAREQYATLKVLHHRFAADHEAISLDRQEIELRHQLGEFDGAEFQRRSADLEKDLAERREALGRAESLKAQFLEAFHSEAELEAAARAPEPAPAPSVVAAPPAPPAAVEPDPAPTPSRNEIPTKAYQTLETETIAPPDATQAMAMPPLPTMEPAPAMPAPPATPRRPPSETQIMPVLDIPLPARSSATPAAPSGATVVVRAARLVPQNPEAGKNSIMLNLKPLNIGADPANDVRVGGPGVEARHAQLTVSMAGYTVVDLGTAHGTRVNAEKVRERLLRDQDVIQVGAARWVFREG